MWRLLRTSTSQLAFLGILAFGLPSATAQPAVPGFDRLAGGDPPSLKLGGHLLLSELGCTACHSATPAWTPSMPPLRAAPSLAGMGTRLRPEWIRDYLTKTIPHGRTMPDLLHHLEVSQRPAMVENLVHFLMSEKGKAPRVMRHGDPAFGRKLYHQIGCVLCHAAHPGEGKADDDTADLDSGKTALPDLAAKYTLDSLTEFLISPASRRPGGRMPAHHLDGNEASDIAGYLVRHDPVHPTEPVRFTPDPVNVKAGRAAFQSLGCVACHAQKGMTQTTEARPLTELNAAATASCLENPGAGMPSYGLSNVQTKALRLALADMGGPIGKQAKLVLWLNALNCLACHERDGMGGVDASQEAWFTGDESLGKDGRFPPHLSGVGNKLNRAWMEQLLAGKGRVRPYLNTRMPVFGKRNTDGLSALLEEIDHDGTSDTHKLTAHGELDAGRTLTGTLGGMGCITCHAWKEHPGLAMHALNLSTTTTRLQPDWFRQYLLTPAALRPGTMMPEFWPAGVSGNPGVLKGDTEKQIASLWRFLKEGTNAPAGYPEHPAGRFVLTPESEVLVQRGFIAPAGTHGIAAGFPEGMHLVFDADTCQMKAVWKGAFVDAYKLWFSRLDPTGKPAGKSVQSFPANIPFKIEGMSAPKPRFKGYALTGPNRAPVFLYQLGPIEVSDLMTPKGGSWHRRLELTTTTDVIRIRLTPGKAKGLTITPDVPSTVRTLKQGETMTLNFNYSW